MVEIVGQFYFIPVKDGQFLNNESDHYTRFTPSLNSDGTPKFLEELNFEEQMQMMGSLEVRDWVEQYRKWDRLDPVPRLPGIVPPLLMGLDPKYNKTSADQEHYERSRVTGFITRLYDFYDSNLGSDPPLTHPVDLLNVFPDLFNTYFKMHGQQPGGINKRGGERFETIGTLSILGIAVLAGDICCS